jgi:hypothetical protein
VLAAVVREQRFGAALAFVVAGAWADRVHAAPIGFRLGVNSRIAIPFRGRSLQDSGAQPLGEAEHVEGAQYARLGRLDGGGLVRRGACGAGEIVNLVDLDVQGRRDVVALELEGGMVEQVAQVAAGARLKVVDAEDVTSRVEQPAAQMRTNEARATGDENAVFQMHGNSLVPTPASQRETRGTKNA